jgi:hypothetical protein
MSLYEFISIHIYRKFGELIYLTPASNMHAQKLESRHQAQLEPCICEIQAHTYDKCFYIILPKTTTSTTNKLGPAAVHLNA